MALRGKGGGDNTAGEEALEVDPGGEGVVAAMHRVRGRGREAGGEDGEEDRSVGGECSCEEEYTLLPVSKGAEDACREVA